MYGLPPTFDFGLFKDRVLELVCFSSNQVIFHFDADVMVTVESAYSVGRAGAPASVVTVPVTESTVMQLLERSVVRAEGNQEGTLILTFDDGRQLAVYDTSPMYESYRIACRGVETIV